MLLKQSQDLSLSLLGERWATLVELLRLRGPGTPALRLLNWGEDARAVESRDWAPLARRAEAIESILQSWGRPLAPHEALP